MIHHTKSAKSDNVIKNGDSEESYPDFNDEPQAGIMPEPEPEPKESGFNWGKLAYNVLAGLAVVAAVTAAAVFVVATAGAGAAVIGAVAAGAAIGGTAAVASMAVSDIRRGEVSDIGDYVGAAARESFIGAVSGAIFGPFGAAKSLGGKMAMGAVTNAFESIVRQTLMGEDINWGTVAQDAFIGGITGGAFHYVGKGIKGASNYVKKSISRAITKNEASLTKLAKNLDDMFAPVRIGVTPEGFRIPYKSEAGTKFQDMTSKIVGKAKDNVENVLLPAERAANKGFKGIKTTKNGGPDFSASEYIKKNSDGKPIVATIDMSGSRSKDFTRAFDDVGIPSSERKKILEDYTWHHVDDYDVKTGKCTMQLVEKEAHKATYPHKGSCAQYDSIHGETYNKKYNGKTPKEKAADNGFIINETENGGADFKNTDYIYKLDSGKEASIPLEMSGSSYKDAKIIYKNLGISKEQQAILEKKYRIFYLDDFDPDTGKCTIQLVDKEAAKSVKNYAGAKAQYKANTGIKYK